MMPGFDDSPTKPPREWAAHIWLGADLFAWLRLMARGRFAFGPKLLHLSGLVTCIGAGHTFLRYAQYHLFDERIRNTPFEDAPIFILGHWRSGTTLLHEYLILDPRFACASTAECFDPCHSLLTDKYVRKYLNWMLPKKRLMDNMAMGWDRPQEDEFALCLLGAPSPYLRMAFPNHGPVDEEAYDLDDLSVADRRRWETIFYRWLQTLNYRHRKTLILKSPPHTCRIPTLLKLFPKARFIHLVRNPFSVFASTVNLWKTLHSVQGVHCPSHAGIEEYVFDRFRHFFQRFESTKQLIPAGQLLEMRYEDLVRQPEAQMERIYQEFGLGDFNAQRPTFEAYLKANAGYERNKWTMSPSLREEIIRRWGDIISHYGYSPPEG